MWWPCLLTDRDEMSNLHRGPSIDASYQVSVHMAEGFQRRRRQMPSDGKSSRCLWQGKLKTKTVAIEIFSKWFYGKMNESFFLERLEQTLCTQTVHEWSSDRYNIFDEDQKSKMATTAESQYGMKWNLNQKVLEWALPKLCPLTPRPLYKYCQTNGALTSLREWLVRLSRAY
jgi:hypothetical protein